MNQDTFYGFLLFNTYFFVDWKGHAIMKFFIAYNTNLIKKTMLFCVQIVKSTPEKGFTKQLHNKTRISSRSFRFLDFISTNRKEVKFCFSLSIGSNKIVQQENNNILGGILVSVFSCFINPFPGKIEILYNFGTLDLFPLPRPKLQKKYSYAFFYIRSQSAFF